MLASIKKYTLYFLLTSLTTPVFGQLKSGVITYERKINLLKKYTTERSRKWIGDEKVKIDLFELQFTGNTSLFKPILGESQGKMDWTTSKNTVYQNLNSKTRLSVYSIWGESVYVRDTAIQRKWKITDRKRIIAGYECRRAIWNKNDSTNIYAWYTNKINPSTGPETFNGLPGTILGLATEDGGVVYFAKTIKESYIDPDQLEPETKKKDVLTEMELRTKLEKRAKGNPWMKKLVDDVFAR